MIADTARTQYEVAADLGLTRNQVKTVEMRAIRKLWRMQVNVPPVRTCEHCGKKFQGRRRDARYCDEQCRLTARYQREKVTP